MRDPRSAGRSRSPEATRAALRRGGRDSRRGPLAPAFLSLKATLQTQKRWKRSRCRAPSVLAAAVAPDSPGRARGRRGTVCRGRVAAGQRSPWPSSSVTSHAASPVSPRVLPQTCFHRPLFLRLGPHVLFPDVGRGKVPPASAPSGNHLTPPPPLNSDM